MVKWVINFIKEVTISSWEYLWGKALKKRLRENCFKMQYRWHLTPFDEQQNP